MAKVTLKGKEHSAGITTIHIPDVASGKDDAGNYKRSRAVPFFRGKGEVSDTDKQYLKDHGVI